MLCEIEFLAVGEGSRAGDAILIRYGELNDFKLMLVDGGIADTGETIVTHLTSLFGQHVRLEHVVLTHSDADHASGLRNVLRQLPVANLWMHIPWVLAGETVNLFKYKDWTPQALLATIKKEYDIISEIVDIASLKKETHVWFPFQGSKIGPFTVLSPRKQNYLHLLPQFDKTPEPDKDLLESRGIWLGKPVAGLFKKFLLEEARKKQPTWIPETWTQEHLKDDVQTSASNESSVVLYGDFGNGRRVLLTGDAGINALNWAASHANASGFVLQQFSFVQIPHHGSRHNVGPTVLDTLIGPIQPAGSKPRFSAYVSAPKDDDQHPRKIVLNAFTRRGGTVIATQGEHKVHLGGFPMRQGYHTVEALPFSVKVEAYD